MCRRRACRLPGDRQPAALSEILEKDEDYLVPRVDRPGSAASGFVRLATTIGHDDYAGRPVLALFAHLVNRGQVLIRILDHVGSWWGYTPPKDRFRRAWAAFRRAQFSIRIGRRG